MGGKRKLFSSLSQGNTDVLKWQSLVLHEIHTSNEKERAK